MNLQSKAQLLFEIEKFTHLTPVQRDVYPLFLKGNDLIVSSETGTGKTHAFLLPLTDKVDSNKDMLQAVIIAPTRELSQQIYMFAQKMKEVDSELRIDLIIGGADRDKMSQKLSRQPHIVVGTPGRILDLFSNGILRCEQADVLILDEADMIWEFGFMDDVAQIVSQMKTSKQMLAFSATIPVQLAHFLKKSMKSPQTISAPVKSQIQTKINHIILDKKKMGYVEIVLDIMKHSQISSLIVFANTREEASEISEELSKSGVDTLELHGDLTSRKRKQTISRLASDNHFVLVATDIAARGLDLPYVSHIMSCGLPSHLEFYLHRAGRTGRIGKEGTCYLVVTENDKKEIEKLNNLGVKFNYQKITEQGFKDIQNFFKKRVYHKKVDPQIQQILNRKNVVVKPNYKKKRKLAISKLEQQKRRKMIQEDIAKQKKERAKARSKSKE